MKDSMQLIIAFFAGMIAYRMFFVRDGFGQLRNISGTSQDNDWMSTPTYPEPERRGG